MHWQNERNPVDTNWKNAAVTITEPVRECSVRVQSERGVDLAESVLVAVSNERRQARMKKNSNNLLPKMRRHP